MPAASRTPTLPALRARRHGLVTALLVAAGLILSIARYAAMWDHTSRLPHPFAGSIDDFFPDVAPVARWLRDHHTDTVALPDRHRQPHLFHRLCEMAYPVRCRPFPEIAPHPGQLAVIPERTTLPVASEPVWRHGELRIVRVTGPVGDTRGEGYPEPPKALRRPP